MGALFCSASTLFLTRTLQLGWSSCGLPDPRTAPLGISTDSYLPCPFRVPGEPPLLLECSVTSSLTHASPHGTCLLSYRPPCSTASWRLPSIRRDSWTGARSLLASCCTEWAGSPQSLRGPPLPVQLSLHVGAPVLLCPVPSLPRGHCSSSGPGATRSHVPLSLVPPRPPCGRSGTVSVPVRISLRPRLVE